MINSGFDKSKQNYNFSAIVEKRNAHDINRFGYVRILLREIRFNGTLLFRDHAWIKDGKRTSSLKPGDLIHFTCKIQPYLDIDNFAVNKLGLVSIRNIKKLHTFKKFKKNVEHYKSRRTLKIYLRKYYESIESKKKNTEKQKDSINNND